MAHLFFDIETIPQGERPKDEEIPIPKNYTKPDTVQNYIVRERENISKT